MKTISLWSDLHLEFQQEVPVWRNPGTDILILSGDICVAEHLYRNPTAEPGVLMKGSYAADAMRYRRFFEHVCREWPTVVYVIGNHEHYAGRWDRTANILRDEFAHLANLHILDDNKLVIDDIVFLGASLWTSLNNGDPLTLLNIKSVMNDYARITEKQNGEYHKLAPATTFRKHKNTVNWLNDQLSDDARATVVVTHHAPSLSSIHPRYANQYVLNSAFVSDLDWIMQQHGHIKLWTHGHVHDRFDYIVNQTRVVCNPNGYPGEQSGFDPGLILKV